MTGQPAPARALASSSQLTTTVFFFIVFHKKKLIFLICNHLPSSAFFIDPQLKFLEKHLILISGIITYLGGKANNVITFHYHEKVWGLLLRYGSPMMGDSHLILIRLNAFSQLFINWSFAWLDCTRTCIWHAVYQISTKWQNFTENQK